MASITAIELGADMCALVRTTLQRGAVHVAAAELLNPTTFPGSDAFTVALRKARRMRGLARRCRVVMWGLPDGASRKDPAAAAALTPLTGAGFRVERVVTPCNALAALARRKPVRGDGPACWIAINAGGVAIVAVRPGQLLYSHSFPWDSTVGTSGSQARLLQRYSLVAFLAPEIKRAMHAARALGFPVTAAVTCGNLPDLRSLTMPLIEELDVEVETLDSLDGLVVKPAAAERLTDVAAAIRVACAGVIARPTRPWDGAKLIAVQRRRALIRAAAVVALIAGLAGAYLGYERWRKSRTPAPAPVTGTARTVPPPVRSDVRGTHGSQSPSRPPLPTTGTQSAPPAASAPPQAAGTAGPPAASVAPPQVRTSRQPSASAPPAPRTARQPAARVPNPPPAPVAAAPQRLSDPLPRVTAILVSNERRFATVNAGRIVKVGDTIGRRVVVRIDARALTLREPSGLRIRVGLGGRRLNAPRGGEIRGPVSPKREGGPM